MIANDIMRTDFISVDKEDVISKLIGKFQVSKKSQAVVLDGKKYAGIVSKRKMLQSKIKPAEQKIKNVAMKPATLTGKESVEKIAALMNTSDVHMLPVIKGQTVKGVVYAIDLLDGLLPLVGDMKVSDVSKGKVVAFDYHIEIGKAINLMRLGKIDRAPLVTKQNKIYGMVSIVDLLMKYEIFPLRRPGGDNIREARSSPGKERDLMCLPVMNEATVDVVTASRDDKLKDVIGLMAKNRIADVVIIDEYNQPVGIVTVKDILKLF